MSTEITTEALSELGFSSAKKAALYIECVPQLFLGNERAVGILIAFQDEETLVYITEWNGGEHPDYVHIECGNCKTIEDIKHLIKLFL